MRNILLLLCFFTISISVFSKNENSSQKEFRGNEAQVIVKGSNHIIINAPSKVASFVNFKEETILNKEQAIALLMTSFKATASDELRLYKTEKDKLGFIHYRYHQYYSGTEVAGGQYFLHEKDNRIQTANGFFVTDLKVSPNAVINSNAAISSALNEIAASLYKWQIPEEEARLKMINKNNSATYYPQPQLVITAINGDFNSKEMRLAYKFDVYAHKPMSRNYVFVDAQTGKVIRKDNRICKIDVASSGATRYSGNQMFLTDSFAANQYRLREASHGNGIETYNMLTGTNYGNAVDFTNNSAVWNIANGAMDEVALDAHWGAERTYDYYKTIHSRNSYDGNDAVILSYVHYDQGYDNAFWNGQSMTYGDGSGQAGGFKPLTAMDVCGHEIAHGVTQFTANLDYSYESGALNESFSDIFGTAIEFYSKPNTADFLIGAEITVTQGTALRDMQNPGAYQNPDTYLGAFWYAGAGDNGGVHYNSGVQNFWFYLLCQGGTGTNDNGNNYNVVGIGMQKAEAIAYRCLSVYLTNTSQYIDARTYSIQAAQDLYGACSPEAMSVAAAWYAVGVGGQFSPTVVCDFSAPILNSCNAPFTVYFTNLSQNTTVFAWDFGDGSTSNLINPSHIYTISGLYTVKLVASGSCGTDSITKIGYISITLPMAPVSPDITHCDPDVLVLNATGNANLNWYNVPQGGTPLYTGTPYTTPLINSTTSFYVESEVPAIPAYVGPVDNTIGTTNNHNSAQDRGLVFNVTQPCVLKSVWVYAQDTANRTINLWDSQGTVLQTITLNIPDSASRINLNFNLTPGTGYEIGGNSMDLFRNTTGMVFPYTLPGYVDITSATSGSDRYYYFYDWEVVAQPCVSARTMMTATIINCGVGVESEDGIDNSISIYPNPTSDNFSLSFKNSIRSDVNIKIYTCTGKLIWEDTQINFVDEYKNTIDMSAFSTGLYVAKVTTSEGIRIKKIIKN